MSIISHANSSFIIERTSGMIPHSFLSINSSLLVPLITSTSASSGGFQNHPLLSHPILSQIFHVPNLDEKTRRTLQLLAAGGFAGGAARTIVAPLDRIKILMQTQALLHNNPQSHQLASSSSASPAVAAAASQAGQGEKYRGLLQALRCVRSEEGFVSLWKGNLINIARVIPYSACQFATYDFIKTKLFVSNNNKLQTRDRLMAGASAGMLATLLTHPMDVIRLRLSVEKELKSSSAALKSLLQEGGVRTLFKGLGPTMLSVSPFIAINFATFDALKSSLANYSFVAHNATASTLIIGGLSGLFAQSICYPLDTIRRRMQLRGNYYSSMINGLVSIIQREGLRGLYRGSSANALKIVPQNAMRFFIYDTTIQFLGMTKSAAANIKAN